MLISLAGLALFVAVGIFAVVGRPITLPDWAKDRIEHELVERFPQLETTIGDILLVVDEGWVPRIQARGITLSDPDTGGVVEVEEIETALSAGALGDMQIAPSSIRISGIYLIVRRLRDGAIDVAIGGAGQSVDPINRQTQVPDIGRQIKAVLSRDGLRSLDSVQLDSVTLRYEDVRAGKAWTIDGGQARLKRDGDDVSLSANLVAVGARAYVSSLEVTYSTRFGSDVADFGVTFEDMPSEDIASQTPALAWLDILRAPISGSLRASTDENGALGQTSIALQIGEGVVQPNDTVRPVPFEQAHTYLSYHPDTNSLILDELSIQANWLRAIAHGTAHLRDLTQGVPEEMVVQLQLDQLEVNPMLLEETPVSLDQSFADFRLQLDPFELSLGQMVLRQGGQMLLLDGQLSTGEDNWEYALNGHMTATHPEAVLNLWPEQVKPKLRTWISENVHQMNMRDINLAVRSRVAQPPSIYADFQFDDLTLRFMKALPVIKGGAGYAMFKDNQFRVGAERGIVTADEGGDVDVTGTGFTILDTRQKIAPAHVQAKAQGDITAALSLLNRPPLSIMDKVKLPVGLAKGHVKAEGDIKLRLKKKVPIEEVHFVAKATSSDIRTSHFIKDKEIRGQVESVITNDLLTISGTGVVGALPVSATFKTGIGRGKGATSELVGISELSKRAIDEFNIGLPEGALTGQGTADFRIDFARGTPPKLSLSSDVSGVRLALAPIGWSKPKEKSGELEVDVTLTTPAKVDRLSFSASGLDAKGSVTLSDAGGLQLASFEELSIGNWFQGQAELRGRGKGKSPEVVITGGVADVRGLPTGGGRSSGGQAAGPISARLDRVQVSENLFLSGVRAEFVQSGGLRGAFSGNLNGIAPVNGQVLPHENGRSAFRIFSERAGQVIDALGFAKAAPQGTMDVSLVPHERKGTYDGTVAANGVKVQGAPALAELINAISIVGLLDQLNGPGITFSELSGQFRLTPRQIIVTQSSAVGPSMGVSMDGAYDMTTKQMDFQGAISPIYFVNAIGRVISKKGEGLIAFNYRLQGQPDALRVSVNPLSALTPGFFREIFRRPPPKLKD
ncbi:AsmA-like C-terminal region-containing protein [Pelagimonas sp. KU-00592-HH]